MFIHEDMYWERSASLMNKTMQINNQSIIDWRDTIHMTTTQVVETSVTVNNNSPIQDYVHPDDQTQPSFEMSPGFKPFTDFRRVFCFSRWTRGKNNSQSFFLPPIGRNIL